MPIIVPLRYTARYIVTILFWSCCTGGLVLALLPADMLTAPVFNWWDKAQHAVGFAILGLLGRVAYPNTRPCKLFAGLLGFGVAIEVAQYIAGWRFGDPLDAVADGVGLLLAAAVYNQFGRH